MTGRPGFPQRTFQVQNQRKAARSQATTVSGLTMANAERQSRPTDPQQAVAGGQFWALSCRPVEHADLMA